MNDRTIDRTDPLSFTSHFLILDSQELQQLTKNKKVNREKREDGSCFREPVFGIHWSICGSPRITGCWIPRAPMKGFWWHLHVGSSLDQPFLVPSFLVLRTAVDELADGSIILSNSWFLFHGALISSVIFCMLAPWLFQRNTTWNRNSPTGNGFFACALQLFGSSILVVVLWLWSSRLLSTIESLSSCNSSTIVVNFYWFLFLFVGICIFS